MGDNGFAFGEHGLIDKRTAYEESMRVPMLMHCPDLFAGGSAVREVVANIDVAPTILEAAGLRAPAYMDGRSFLALAGATGAPRTAWRDALLYEYYWERNFPHTPTIHALRDDRYKYVHVHGLWDSDELYDLQEDPAESKNLINRPELRPVVERLNRRLFETLEATDGMYLPLNRDIGPKFNLRREGRSVADPFPPEVLRRGPTTEPIGPPPAKP
jgi:N-acetylglucosamine-6-sulfatase